MLYIYTNFIKDYDEDIYKEWAKPFMNFLKFIRGIYFWILSILLFPFFIIGMNIETKIFEIIKINKKIYIKN